MAEPFAEPRDIEKVRPWQADWEHDAAAELLVEASAKLRGRVRRLDERIASGDLDPAIPAGIVRRMVIDVLNNPDGFISEQAGDTVFRMDPETVRRRMQPTDAELEDLRPRAASRPPARTIRIPPCW